jgi:preprotein translocase subunit SecD
MKSINYIFISLFILITLCSGIFLKTEKNVTITLQAEKNAGSVALKQSADIISARLKLYGVKSFDVSVSSDIRQLKIRLPESANVTEIESLLTSRGELAFYETYTQEVLKSIISPDNQLFELLGNVKNFNSSDPRVGCTNAQGRKKAEDYLASAPKLKECKLAWQSDSEKPEVCLFALKTGTNGNPLINRSDIESVKITDSNDGARIMIKLKPSAAGLFAAATRANLDKSIAIVIDDKVYSWPVVRSAIEGGEIEVTGSFTENEVKDMPVIFNTNELPLELKLVK